MKKVVVISAHPDDETLGAGGTLLRHKANGDTIYWINVTKMLEKKGFSAKHIEKRESEIKQVIKCYNCKEFFQLNYISTELNSSLLSQLVLDISSIFKKTTPEVIYCINRSDAHSDHRVLFEAVYSCTKAFRHPYIKEIYMYECLSETEFAPPLAENMFIPNYFVDISEFLNQKIEIMKTYSSEIGEPPFPRSEDNIRALATLRGSTVGVKAAEAFQVLKIIKK